MFSPFQRRSTDKPTTQSRRRGLLVERLEPRALLTASGFYIGSQPGDLRLFQAETHNQRFGPTEISRIDSRMDGRVDGMTINSMSNLISTGWLERVDRPAVEGATSARAMMTIIELRTLPAGITGGDIGFGGRVGGMQILMPGSYLQNPMHAELGRESLMHEPSSLVAGIENAAANRPNGLGALSTGLNNNHVNSALRSDGSTATSLMSSSHGAPTNVSAAVDLSTGDSTRVDLSTRDEAERLRLNRDETSDEGGYVNLETSIDTDLPWAGQALRSVASKEKSSLVARFNEDGSRWGGTKAERAELARARALAIPAAAIFGARQADEVFGDEGGMIEMMVDAGSYAPTAGAEVTIGFNLPISIDRAIGLFQSMELASSPDDTLIQLPLAPSQPHESPKVPAAPEPTVRAEQAVAPEGELSSIPLSRAIGVPVMAGALFSVLSTTSSRNEIKQLPRKPR